MCAAVDPNKRSECNSTDTCHLFLKSECCYDDSISGVPFCFDEMRGKKRMYRIICEAANLIVNKGCRAAGEAPLIHNKVGMLSILSYLIYLDPPQITPTLFQ